MASVHHAGSAADMKAESLSRRLEGLGLRQSGEPNPLPFDIIVSIIESADQPTLCNLARVSREVGQYALRELYTHLQLLGHDWETDPGAPEEDLEPSEQPQYLLIAALGRGVLAFVERTNAEVGAKTLFFGKYAPTVIWLADWAFMLIDERRPLLEYLSSAEAATVDGSQTSSEFSSLMSEFTDPKILPNLTQLYIDAPGCYTGGQFGDIPRALTTLSVEGIVIVDSSTTLFSSTLFSENVLTLCLAIDDVSPYHMDRKFMLSLGGFKTIRNLVLRGIATHPDSGMRGRLAGILGPHDMFPLLEKMDLSLYIVSSTLDIFFSDMIGGIRIGCERSRWPHIREIELHLTASCSSRSKRMSLWLVQVNRAFLKSGWTSVFEEKAWVSGKKVKF